MLLRDGVKGTNEGPNDATLYGTTHSDRVYNAGHGFGNVLPALVNAAVADPDLPIYKEAIAYQANAFDGSGSYSYGISVNAGAWKLHNEIEYLAATCPYTNILLTGYSQGAQVIGDVLTGTQVDPLGPTAKAHISAVVLFADPSYRTSQPWDALGDGTGNGAFVRAAGAFSSYQRLVWVTPNSQGNVYTVKSVCLSGDEWCQTNHTPAGYNIHANGYTSSVVASQWSFMRSFLVTGE